jgi:hypothetical protein
MIIGMSVATFTILHVLISLVGIVAGVAALGEMIVGRRVALWNAVFLAATIATSITGFLFHSQTFGPPHVIGVISLIVLAVAVFALKGRNLEGVWRSVYAVSATVALYLNAFVGVVQAFQKLSGLKELAPTQSEPPFVVAQSLLLIIFASIGFLAFRRFSRTDPGVNRLLAG